MANGSRFPPLALPFAIIGAAAGWLSMRFLSNPVVHMTWPGKEGVGTLIAMLLAATTGVLLTRWCVPRWYAYDIDTPDPDARPPTDSYWRHVSVVLLAGALTGLAISLLYDTYRGPLVGAWTGMVCAAAFLPVCVAVIVAARRAQRARLGSLVSDSDRRAVWGILATTMAGMTLSALPDWLAFRAREAPLPMPALLMVYTAGAVILGILIADRRALREAQASITAGLTERDPTAAEPTDTTVPRLDLGLGEQSWAQLARGASAYRSRDRTLALVQGSPEQAHEALRRAIRRGVVGLSLIGAVGLAHAAAQLPVARALYDERRCEMEDFPACARAGDALLSRNLRAAMDRYEQACAGSDADGCRALAEIYERGDAPNERLAATGPDFKGSYAIDHYRARACDTGTFSACQ